MEQFLVIMCYNSGSVCYTSIAKGLTSEEVEEIIVELEFNLDEVYYMTTDKLEINQINRP